MGTFGGHVLPGSFFILFALWWTIQIFNRYFNCLRNNVRFTSTLTFPCSCLCGRAKDWPIEGLLKIVFVSIGISLEIYTGSVGSQLVHIGNGQHSTMFFFFGITGIFDILMYFKLPLPPDTDYAFMVLALTVEGLIFNFHLHGRTELDTLVHVLLIYGVVANIIALLFEIRYRHNVVIALARTYGIFVQGTWFWQVAFILYPLGEYAERWDEDDQQQMMLAVMIFTWHLGAVALIMLIIGGTVACYHTRFKINDRDDDIALKRLIETGSDGETVVRLYNDE